MKHIRRRPPPDQDLALRRELLDEAGIARTLRRMAHEIVERHPGGADLALVGIRTGGLVLAERLVALLHSVEGATVPLGAIDITLYRDDVFHGLPRPEVGSTELPFELSGRTIVLVDDVLYTGRTIRAALDALVDFGGRAPSSWRCSSIAAIASCPSRPTTRG